MKTTTDWKRKLSSRKFWSLLAALVVSCLTAFGGTEELALQITGIISAVGACVVYMLAEGMADSAGARMEVEVMDVIEKDNEK
jgi:hypothetical protein